MSLPFLLSSRPTSVNGGSKVRGGAGKKPSQLGGGRSSLDKAKPRTACKRALSALAEPEVEHVPWKEIFGLDDDAETSIESVRLKRVAIVGLGELGSRLVESLAGKPSIAKVGVHGFCGIHSKYDIMPGVTPLPTAGEVCAWSDFIILCGAYDDAHDFLRMPAVSKNLKKKCVIQLGSGTPEEAIIAAGLAKKANAKYLDAFVFSEGTATVFSHRLSAMMVSGDKKAWREVEGVIRAVAPASFYGGRRVEWANTVGVGVATFLASVRMGLQQAQSITGKFSLPPHVLSRVLNSGYLHSVRGLIEQSAPVQATSATSAQTTSLPSMATNGSYATSEVLTENIPGQNIPGRAASVTTASPSVRAAAANTVACQPAVGSAEWRLQLEKIREVCQKANVDYTLIDGFLAASGSSPVQRMSMNGANHHIAGLPAPIREIRGGEWPEETTPDPAQRTVSNMSEAGGAVGGKKGPERAVSVGADLFGGMLGPAAMEGLDFAVQDMLMDTEMVGDEVLHAAWAP